MTPKQMNNHDFLESWLAALKRASDPEYQQLRPRIRQLVYWDTTTTEGNPHKLQDTRVQHIARGDLQIYRFMELKVHEKNRPDT
jgi:hypothetical protein